MEKYNPNDLCNELYDYMSDDNLSIEQLVYVANTNGIMKVSISTPRVLILTFIGTIFSFAASDIAAKALLNMYNEAFDTNIKMNEVEWS
jgi:hypothetical protein